MKLTCLPVVLATALCACGSAGSTFLGNQVTLTWQEVADPTHAAAKIYDLSMQGQQGSILQDVGFNIDDTKNYVAGLEASSGTKAIVTGAPYIVDGGFSAH